MQTTNPGNQPETEEPIEPGIVPDDTDTDTDTDTGTDTDTDTPVQDDERPEDWKDPNEPDSPSTEQPDQGTAQPVNV
ncbi:hypothetical protein [Pseudomonas sp. F(2018)]|uniref:hypothetical protein n=1 Tax=Pseudomonas sp. F(2018) TaxID=2502240 RepID=UPI0010F4CBFE|nr:hypothetical protein [Pseudomonas sp. F(2018)]